MFLNLLILMIFLFMSLAFYTIMERKILGIFHIRIGPNKVGLLGIFQPFSDVLKLFSKSMNYISKINQVYWNLSSIFLFCILILMFFIFPMKMENNNLIFNFMYMFLFLGLSIFPIFLGSFFSFSKFSIISSKRSISQMLSYELGIMFILIFSMCFLLNCNFEFIIMNFLNLKLMKFFIMFMLFILILMETSRIPFDFIESESELVSGFNTEYTSIYFSMFFVFEYGMMLIFSIFISLIYSNFFFSFMMLFLFIHLRSSFPRFRYDQMMLFIWKLFYPFMILFCILFKMF